MSLVVSFVVTVLFALLEGSYMISVSKATRTVNLTWSANVSSMYPPSSPLRVYLGDQLNITCPPDATSNIWIQEYIEQYDQCNCNATGMGQQVDCTPDTATRQICHDEVLMAIRTDSNTLRSALSFTSGKTYYLISYSTGNGSLAGYGRNISGGECLRGFKMVLRVASGAETEPALTTTAVPTTTSSADSLSISTGLPPQGIVNEDNLPVDIGSIGNLVNGATATSTVTLTLLLASIVLALLNYI